MKAPLALAFCSLSLLAACPPDESEHCYGPIDGKTIEVQCPPESAWKDLMGAPDASRLTPETDHVAWSAGGAPPQ